jgi:hypothetical protein
MPPGVGHGRGLDDAADGLAGLGSEQEVEVVGPRAVAEEAERIAFPGVGEGERERLVVLGRGDDVGAIVAPDTDFPPTPFSRAARTGSVDNRPRGACYSRWLMHSPPSGASGADATRAAGSRPDQLFMERESCGRSFGAATRRGAGAGSGAAGSGVAGMPW